MDKDGDILFEDIENFYGKHLRKTDLVFYHQEQRAFIFVFPITKIEKVKFIKEKVVSNLANYYLKVNSYYITKNKEERRNIAYSFFVFCKYCYYSCPVCPLCTC